MYVSTQKEWLCLNCQTQRQLEDSEKMTQPSPASAKPETHVTPAVKKPESKTIPVTAEAAPATPKSQPVPATTKAVPTAGPTPKANMESTLVTTEITAKATCGKIEPPTAAMPTIAELGKKPSEASTAGSDISFLATLQNTAVSHTDVPKSVTVTDNGETRKTDLSLTELPKIEETNALTSKVKVDAVKTVASSTPVTDTKAVPSPLVDPELPASEEISKEIKPDDHIKPTGQTTSLQQVEALQKSQEPQRETKPVKPAESKDLTSTMVEELTDTTSVLETQVSTKDTQIKVRLNVIYI